MTDERVNALVERVRCFAKKYRLDQDKTQTAIGLAWYRDRTSGECHPLGTLARWAVYHTLSGQDIPGLKQRRKDALKAAQLLHAASRVVSREDGPEESAIAAETWHLIDACLTDEQRTVFRCRLRRLSTQRIVKETGLPRDRIDRLRRIVLEALRQ